MPNHFEQVSEQSETDQVLARKRLIESKGSYGLNSNTTRHKDHDRQVTIDFDRVPTTLNLVLGTSLTGQEYLGLDSRRQRDEDKFVSQYSIVRLDNYYYLIRLQNDGMGMLAMYRLKPGDTFVLGMDDTLPGEQAGGRHRGSIYCEERGIVYTDHTNDGTRYTVINRSDIE